jgi:beta-mannosidase
MFSANLPPSLQVGANTGPTLAGKFASEFGCAGMSSFESMSETLKPEHWSIHASPMAQRNYPCDNIIEVYFGIQNFSETGEIPFKRQLYQCLIGQALELKSDIEGRRSWNEWGVITWQINEIWPTGGWGSIEYGSPTIGGGQVIGGRWKPLHHWLAGPVYSDLMSTCSSSNPPQCMIRNDGISPFTGKVVISIVRFSDAKVTTLNTVDVSLASGAGVIKWFCTKQAGNGCDSWSSILASGGCTNGNFDCIVITSIHRSDGSSISENFVPLTSPLHMNLPTPSISFVVDNQGLVTLKSDKFAVFVTLTTRAQGRFSDNAFLLFPGTKQVQFLWFGTPDVATLKSTLRVEHVQMYLSPPTSNLARGKACKASSVDDNSRLCSAAFDDDLSTRWSSNYTDANWITVDLGAQTKISRAVLYWESAYAKSFQIQTSTDGNSWTTKYENDAGVGGVTTIPLSVTSRWVKMNAIARASKFGYSLWEFQLF